MKRWDDSINNGLGLNFREHHGGHLNKTELSDIVMMSSKIHMSLHGYGTGEV